MASDLMVLIASDNPNWQVKGDDVHFLWSKWYGNMNSQWKSFFQVKKKNPCSAQSTSPRVVLHSFSLRTKYFCYEEWYFLSGFALLEQ